MLRHFGKLLAASTISLLCLPALAQNDGNGSISGAGQVVLQTKATALRLQLFIMVQGDDMQTTLTRLERKGDEVRKALLKAKADPKSIKLDGPRLVGALQALGDLLPVQQQYWGKGKANQQPIPQYQYQLPAQQPKPQYPSQPLPLVETKRGPRITLQAHLTAEWPLLAETTPDLLVEADRIVLLMHEEIEQFMPPESPSPKPVGSDDEDQSYEVSGPQYLFVGRIAGEKVRQSRVEAFEKAKARAEAVAKTAGCRIGPLLELSTSSSGFGGDGEYDPFAPVASFATPPGMGNIAPAISPTNNADWDMVESVEVAASEPSGLRFSVGVRAKFRLLQPVQPSEANR